MIEYLGDLASIICLFIALFYAGLNFYKGLVQHRELYFQRREEAYYNLFDDSDDSEFDERDEPYYED